MAENEKTYIAIDLKSFYASVECRERKLDCMTTNLVVADKSRTEKTICLAVSPSLKAYDIIPFLSLVNSRLGSSYITVGSPCPFPSANTMEKLSQRDVIASIDAFL